jgi:hypothetical protein
MRIYTMVEMRYTGGFLPPTAQGHAMPIFSNPYNPYNP